MSAHVTLTAAGPGITVQDFGRRGYIAQGLSRGGAADRLALIEAAALLDQGVTAALELPPVTLSLKADAPVRIAFTGSPMTVTCDGETLSWSAVHRLEAGETVSLRPSGGGFSYVSFGGGLDTPERLGSRSAHLATGIGKALESGDSLPLLADEGREVDRVLDAEKRFGGGTLRLLPSAHTTLFSPEHIARLETTEFTRDRRGNRQGIRLSHDGEPFATDGQLTLLSEIARAGDIQMTGDGEPYLLGPECQTTGGYPRIGAVVPADMPRAVQAPAGAKLKLKFVSREEATKAHQSDEALLKALRRKVRPLTRDPHDIRDLGRYQLISGVTTGRPDEESRS